MYFFYHLLSSAARLVISGFAFLAGWCLGHFLVWYMSPTKAGRTSAIAAAMVSVILLLVGSWRFTTFSHQRDQLAAMRVTARDAKAAPECLERLAASTNEYVLGDVAGNPKVSEATLRKLADNGKYLVEWDLARNRNAPRDILSRLANSPNEYTRGSVAANPNAPTEVLVVLSKDVVGHVRVSVAQNPSTPRSTIEDLLEDSDETVRRLAYATMRQH